MAAQPRIHTTRHQRARAIGRAGPEVCAGVRATLAGAAECDRVCGHESQGASPRIEAAHTGRSRWTRTCPKPTSHSRMSIAMTSGGGESVLAELRRALELNPNSSLAMYQYGRRLDTPAESMSWLKKTLQIDPLAITPRANLIIGLNQQGDDRARDRRNCPIQRTVQQRCRRDDDAGAICLRALNNPLCAARAARRAIQLAPTEPTPGAVVYLHRALLAVGAYDEAAELQARTDWKRVAPDIWAYESALAAGSRPDPAGLASAIEEVRALAPDPARAAALLYWLTLAGRSQEAAKLVDEASTSGPLHTYSLTGLERSGCDIAALWSLRTTEPPSAFRRDFEDVLRDAKKGLANSPTDAQALLDSAALRSMNGDDAIALAMLQRAFKRSALPSVFMPHLPWFARSARPAGYSIDWSRTGRPLGPRPGRAWSRRRSRRSRSRRVQSLVKAAAGWVAARPPQAMVLIRMSRRVVCPG